MKAQVNLGQILQGGLAALVGWLFKTVNDLQQEVATLSMDMKVELQSHGKGKFGRILGEFFCNDININKQMVSSGHAVNYDGGKR
jgi:hypothetical protein